MARFKSDEPCVACRIYIENGLCYHHILTRKAYPEFTDEVWNKISSCQQHHNEWHSKSIEYMAGKYPGIALWLAEMGWGIINGEWKPRVWQ